ncbi:DNA (cytosine-5)-methyltransferase 1 [Streptomyces sp. 3330]|uniref:DNA cytosine methyltransferase n=1 Tax=Streptomyces sp. 3330 TaxID=2817755 RepID=UPI002866D5E1|nr:DNA cytosine methyltransferase [Streptomyces sp. 3330]MDR6978572.1 DNA (cytosine-5)-methyltransferase 1 [Streptomyces sp. 3330]
MARAPHPDAKQDPPVIVDLFAGPGGLDIAAEVLGVPSIGVEWEKSTRATRHAAGLRTTEVGDVAKVNPLDPEVRSASVLTGGPPCQTYSVAGNREGHKALEEVMDLAEIVGNGKSIEELEKAWAEVERRAHELAWADERTGLVLQPLRWIVEKKLKADPYDVVVLEQVPTVLPVWKKYREILRDLGYDADCHILHTEEYGVPQTRRRAVLIARYQGDGRGRDVEFPPLTHQRYRKGAKRLPAVPEPTVRTQALQQSPLFDSLAPAPQSVKPWVSMGDALKDSRSTDFVVRSNYGSGGDPKKRGLRASDVPSATVTGKVRRNTVFDLKGFNADGEPELGPEQDRFTFREVGLLQTFPVEYPWQGTDVAQQIGNAIPPLLALHVLCTALGLDESRKERAIEALKCWRPPHL